MKGHIQIELKNEKSGKVDVYEQDNMVTSAVAKVLGMMANFCGLYDGNANYIGAYLLPISTKALGGLFLFDGMLKEDIDNIHFPMDVHLVGSAGRTENASIEYMGSLNALESGETDTGYVNVWDFSTSQANGRIASLALTNARAGGTPFYSSRWIPTGSGYLGNAGIAYNSEKGIVYTYSRGKIYADKLYTDILKVNCAHPTDAKQEIFDFSFANPDYQYWQISNGYDGYVYALYIPGSSTGTEKPVQIRKIRISDYSFLEEEGQSIVLNNIPLKGSIRSGDSDSVFKNTCAINKGYLYAASYDQTKVIRINLSNTVEQKEFTFDGYMIKSITPKYNGGVYAVFSKGSKLDTIGIIYPDGEYKYDKSHLNLDSPSYASVEGENLMLLTTYPGCSLDYLGTICNLSSPVVKTSEQSMKITYTLTDV